MADRADQIGDSPKGPNGKSAMGSGAQGSGLNNPFTLFSSSKSALPVLISVPHAGRDYPGQVLAEMREPDFVMSRLEDRYVDKVAHEAQRWVGASLLVAHAPRAMLDLNRSREDVDWSMISGLSERPPRNSQANRRARSGLGLVPRRLLGMGEIWRERLPNSELRRRIDTIHRPYHQALAQELSRIRDEWGAALLIDLHSMPPLRARGDDARGAEFVIGDRFGTSCDAMLVSKGLNFLESRGKIVSHNRPYSGGYVLMQHGMPRHGIHAIQLEVCRSLYLDEALDLPGQRLADVGRLVASLANSLGREVATLGKSGFLAQAAE